MDNNQAKNVAIMITIVIFAMVACTNSQTEDVQSSVTPKSPEIIYATITIASTLSPTPYPLSALDPIWLGDYKILSPDDMRSDLDKLFDRLESTHPNLYGKRTKEDVDFERQRIYTDLGQPMTDIAFFRRVAPLVASLGDYHTRVFLPNDTIAKIAENEIFFPFGVEFDNQRALITENYSDNANIPLGAELLKLNGVALSDIQGQRTSQGWDAYPFWFSLWYLYGSIPEYQLKLLLPGETSPVTFNTPGLTSETINQKAEDLNPYVPLSALSYETLPGEKIGILTINNFTDIVPYLKPAFTQIQEAGVEHLIIDIRSNGGGKYIQVDLLMNYLTNQPYQQCSRSYFMPPGGDSSAGPQEAECSLKEPANTPLQFDGQMYLLVGPNTISAAITFATILQDYDLAVLIGEETIDTASYCAFVPDAPQIISMSLFYKCSEKCYIRPSGVLDENGVIPDILVETTVHEKLEGIDPVVNYTLEMIRSGAAPLKH